MRLYRSPTSAPPEAFPSNVGIEETRLPLQREPEVETPPESSIRLAGWKGRSGGARSEAEMGPASIEESSSAQLTKITNLAMNVMAASQQLTVNPTRPTPTNPPNPE
jgi:hypothetical protein